MGFLRSFFDSRRQFLDMNDPEIANEGPDQQKPSILSQLLDHQVKEELALRWKELNSLWKDQEIYDCTLKAARLVIIYATLEDQFYKQPIPAGRSFFCWNRDDETVLSLYILNGNNLENHTIQITAEGKLIFNQIEFVSPQDILNTLTFENRVVYQRIDIFPDTALSGVLLRNLNPTCSLYFPPDYPPLLMHIALANHDLATAEAILNHPFIDDPKLSLDQNNKLITLLQASVTNAILEDQIQFLNFLLEKYDFSKFKFFPSEAINSAIQLKNQKLLKYLFEKTPPSKLVEAYEAAFVSAVRFNDEVIFRWLINTLPERIPTLSFCDKLKFLAEVFEVFGNKDYELFIGKLNIKVDWSQFLNFLMETKSSPIEYLPLFCLGGNATEELPMDSKVKLVIRFLEKLDTNLSQEEAGKALNFFLDQFFPKGEHQAILSATLNQVMKNKKNIELLLYLKVVPTKEHFLSLLQAYDEGNEREELFLSLLNAITDLNYAKSTLTIASALGQKAISETFKKFPELSENTDFLVGLMQDVWKGTEVATDQLLNKVMAGQAPYQPDHQEIRPPSLLEGVNLPLECSFLSSVVSQELSTEFLVEVLLPRGQIEKIRQALSQRPECFFEFWFKIIFSGYSNFEGIEWEKLVSETFLSLEEQQQGKLIGQALCYSHLQLASLWLKAWASAFKPSMQMIFSWYHEALQSGNPESVAILGSHNLLFLKNENNESFLHLAARNNAIRFIEPLINHPLSKMLLAQDISVAYKEALENQRLTICFLLRGDVSINEIVYDLESKSTSEIECWLLKAFLNSTTKHVLLLMQQLRVRANDLPQNKQAAIDLACQKIQDFMQESGPLIVRYPFPETQIEVHALYGKAYPNYEDQQKNWGAKCANYYERFFNEFRTVDHALLELLIKFSTIQPGRRGYNLWRMGSQSALFTHFTGRYFYFWQFLQKIYKKLLNDPTRYKDELYATEKGYQILYKMNESTIVPLSALYIKRPFSRGVFKGMMMHTFVQEVDLLLPHLEDLLKEVKNFSFSEGNMPISPPVELKRKIALIFWLGCHLVVTARGSSQYMLMLHRLLYEIHGYQVTPWSLEFIQPDCIAIMLPFSIFFEEYYDRLFER